MKRSLYTLLAITVLAGLTGCAATNPMNGPGERRGVGLIRGSCARAPETAAACTACDPGDLVDCPRCGRRHGRGGPCEAAAGPSMGAVTYPYYTLRGPRDFLDRNPQSIGP